MLNLKSMEKLTQALILYIFFISQYKCQFIFFEILGYSYLKGDSL